MSNVGMCQICEKQKILTRHHLIPRSVTNQINPNHKMADTVVKLCDDCHKAVHQHVIDHIFLERKFTPGSRVDYLKLYMLKDYLKKNYRTVWQEFKKHWKQYLKDELNQIEED